MIDIHKQPLTRMILKRAADVAQEIPKMDGIKDARMRLLLGEPDGMPNFFLREFTVDAGGYTPRHQHNYEHEVYIIDGAGEVECAGETAPLRAGQALFIPANSLHQFRAADVPLKFLCIVPAAPFRTP